MTTTATLADVLTRAGLDGLAVLDATIDVPILAGVQAQGDVIVLPRPTLPAATTPLPTAGAVVVRAETSQGHTHRLLSWDGPTCLWDPTAQDDDEALTLGTLTVPDGATAYLVHDDEHGANGIAPGTYVLRRQREQADVIRRVAD